MIMTFVFSLIITGINQIIKMLMRVLDISKATATKIVLSLGLLMSIAFTFALDYQLFSMEQLTSITTLFLSSVGTYEMVLKKFGIDKAMKQYLLVENKK